MEKKTDMDIETGYFLKKYPYVKWGNGANKFVIIPPTGELRVSAIKDPKGQIAGTKFLIRPIKPNEVTIYILGFPHKWDEGFGYLDIVEDYKQIFENYIKDKASIIAISYGGKIGINFAAKHPDYVNKLVLLVTAHRLSESGLETIKKSIDLAKAGKIYELDQYFNELYKRKFWKYLNKALTKINFKKTLEIQNPISTFIQAYQQILDTNGEETKILSKISASTLIIGGTKDVFFSPDIFKEAAEKIPNSKLVLFENEYHMVPIERFSIIRKTLREFLL